MDENQITQLPTRSMWFFTYVHLKLLFMNIQKNSFKQQNPGKVFTKTQIELHKFLCVSLLLLFVFNASGQTIFEDDFNSGVLNPLHWTAHPNLTGTNGIIEISNSADHNSNGYGVVMGKTSDNGGFTTNALDLRLNLAGQNQVELEFWIRDFGDETQTFDGLYFSDNNGATFKKVLPFDPGIWCNDWGRFPPIDVDQLAAKHGLNLTSNFIIRFQQYDDGDFYGGGPAGQDGFHLDDVNVYVPQVKYASVDPLDFFDDFETGKFGTAWAWRFADSTAQLLAAPTQPSGFVELYSGIGNNSQYAVAMGRYCDGSFSTNALDLHLNLAGQDQVELTFDIYDLSDETQIDDGLWFSDNGGLSFKQVYQFRPDDWCNQWGQYPPFDVDELAAKHGLNLTDKFIIRFQQHDDGDFYGGGASGQDGIYLDNVRVYVPKTAYAQVRPDKQFCDDFETGKFGTAWAWRFADSTSALADVPSRPSNFVGVVSGAGNDSQYGVVMGKRCDDGFAANALDLHLNLAGQSQVELRFDIRDFADETQNDDGLWFSDDGGLSFKLVYPFRPADWCDQWGQFPPFDVDELAAKYGLSLTDKFIIRFQQHDDGDFYGGGSFGQDGFYIDNVCVYVPEIDYATVPFTEDFETGYFSPYMAWRFADATNTLAAVPSRPSNFVGVVSGIGLNSQYAVALGKACDDGFATNALDLRLKLAGKSNVQLSFWLRNFSEETQVDDGIYVSADGGKNFKKAYAFNFDVIPVNVYEEFNLSIDALASAAGVPFTNQFVIRFQQHDDGDFYGGGSFGQDGFYIDNINITGITSLGNLTDGHEVSVFPNPAANILHIQQSQLETSSSSYRLLDLSGRVLKTGIANDETTHINIAELQAGLYLLELRREGMVVAREKVQKL